MLPKPTTNIIDPNDIGSRYGSVAMEKLINAILKYGGSKADLEVKLFGGARVLEIESPVGDRNIEFVMSYIRTEGLALKGLDLGGTIARKVQYLPQEGRARVRQVALKNKTISQREKDYAAWVSNTPLEGEVVFFDGASEE